MAQILVIEDQPHLRRSIVRTLEEAGFQVVPVGGLEAASSENLETISLVILDLMLPDGNGLDWLRKLRCSYQMIPVLILTARDAIEDRVKGLDSGANDYMVKPFAFEELLARIRVLLRNGARNSPSQLEYRDVQVDLLSRRAVRGGKLLQLQNRQLEILIFFLQHVNEIVTREDISKDVWQEKTATWTNVIEVHINQLRKQLERPDTPTLLHTIRGQGYLFGDCP